MAEKVAKVELNAEELNGLMWLIKDNNHADLGHLYYVFAQHWDHLTNFGDDYEL